MEDEFKLAGSTLNEITCLAEDIDALNSSRMEED